MTMKTMKSSSVLAAGSIAICSLLGTSMALAEEVCLDGDTVIGIKDLEVVTDQHGILDIDVDFRYATGFQVYGSGLGNFPFDSGNAEEDVFATMAQINDALDDANPVPESAGQPGQDVYYIGVEEETDPVKKETKGDITLIAAAGSENLSGDFWDPCTMANDCIAGVAALQPDERVTYADLSQATGSDCNEAPGPSFTITPGITGSWYDPARDGEGYNIEIIGSSLDPIMLAYFYTYEEVVAKGDSRNQMWLTGTGSVDGDTASMTVQVTSGTAFGPDFDADDVIKEDWGTLTFTFTSCNKGTATYDSDNGKGTGTANIERITAVTGVACP